MRLTPKYRESQCGETFHACGRRMLILALLLCSAWGCSKEDLTKAMDDAKATTRSLTEKTKSLTESAVAAVEERLPETGSVRLEMTPPAEMQQAEIEIMTIGDGRPNVVQIATYDTSSEAKAYPALLLHGPTTASDVASLAGASIECDLYFQAAIQGPIAMTQPGQSVKVTFGSIDTENGAIPASFETVELAFPDNTKSVVRRGELVLVMRGAN